MAAVEFFLLEAPVISDAPAIFGQPSTVHCYHRVVEFADKLFRGELTWLPGETQGHAVIRPNKKKEAGS